jgi:prolyl oligopeptidase PreP (S9A serine peptidase family)
VHYTNHHAGTRETRQAVWDDLRAVRERVEGSRAH